MNSTLQQQLKKYSALSAGLISCASVDAAVQTGNLDKTIYSLFYYSNSYDYSIDLDGDGIVDFIVGEGAMQTSSNSCPIPLGYYIGLSPFIYGLNGEVITNGAANPNNWYDPNCSWLYNQVGGTFASLKYVEQLSAGVNVSSAQNFLKQTRLCNNVDTGTYPTFYTSRNGNWSADTQTNYIGVRFNIGANTHYGWVRITIDNINHELTFLDYAYEDTPDTPINAGATFFAPPPAGNALASYSGSSLTVGFGASQEEQTVEEYRLFVVKEGNTFSLQDAEANSNYVAVTPDGSTSYLHAFDPSSPDSDGDIFTKSGEKATFLDTDGQAISANQNYQVYILNIGAAPYTYNNVLSAPSNSFTVSDPVGVEEHSESFRIFANNNQLHIEVGSELIGAEIKVLDIRAKEVLKDKLTTTEYKADLNLKNGIYIVSIIKGKTLLNTKVLIR